MLSFQAVQVHKETFSRVSIVPSEVAKEKSLDAMYRMIASSDIDLTVELVAWVGMHALIPFNSVFSLQHSVFLSNPVQALLYHYLVTELLCFGVENDIATKLPGDKSHSRAEHAAFIEQTKAESKRMTEICKDYCSRHEITVPDFEEFYFQPLEEAEEEEIEGTQNDDYGDDFSPFFNLENEHSSDKEEERQVREV